MAPIATSDLNPAGLSPCDMDSTVFPSPAADEELTRLWNLHGDPHSSKFANPKLTSIARLVEHNATVQPSQAAFIYPANSSFSIINWSALHDLCRKAAALYAERFRQELQVSNQTGAQLTIALLGTGSSIDYLITQIALNILRLRVLLLSNKNAPGTREHLLRACDAAAVIVDRANEASLHGEEACRLPVVDLVGLEHLRKSRPRADEWDTTAFTFATNDEWNLQAMIIHSSGSTGVPKPVIHTNRSLCQIARMYRLLPEYYIENWYLCFPLFHVAGLSVALSGLPTGLPTTLPPEQWPPAPSSILSAWRALEDLGYPADCLHCAPSVIEDLYEYITLTSEDYTPLVKLKVLQPGGAPLSPSILSKVQALGVNVKTTYGTSEIGPPFRTIPHTRDNPDVYRFRNLYPESPLVQMESVGDGLFECVVYKGFPLAAELWLDDAAPNPYRTGDLFLQDPPASGYFVLQGRRDDILIHSNGEKTHASAVAMALEEDKTSVISKAAVFGTGRPCPAAVIEVDWQAVDGQSAGIGLDDEVWRVVRECNGKLATFSKMPRETIVILERGETLPVTPKGNVRRNNAWELYGDRVEQMYKRFLGDAPGISVDQTKSQPCANGLPPIQVIQNSVAEVFGLSQQDLAEDQNWYELGLDSLKAVDLRAKLVRSFGSFPLMFIFECPTARRLLEFLQRSGKEDFDKSTVTDQHHQWIQSTVRRMNQRVDQWTAQRPASLENNKTPAVIYLTGASGFLGNALLEVVVRSKSVTKVYCAVRGRDPQARVVQSMISRGFGKDVYQSDKICAVNYDMGDERLGLSEQTYEQLAGEVTLVMHNAWKLDFNQPVQQFENDCLEGTMNLMSFCLRGQPKRFAFMSSVAAAMGSKADGRVPELPLGSDPALALPTGYAQSKFVVEQVTQHFASSFDIPTHILRVGQLCGHSRLGTWNRTEMWPIMMMTALDHLSAMPVLQTKVDWLPVDVCAEAIGSAVLDSDAEASSYTVTNLTNPDATSWEELLDFLDEASGRTMDRIEMKDWVSRLEALTDVREAEERDIPALKLLGFFQTMAGGGANGEGVEFEVTRVETGRRLSADAVGKWLESWDKGGHLKL